MDKNISLRIRLRISGRKLTGCPAPRSVAKHYFDEHINTPSEVGDGSLYSAYSTHSDW